jgi:hypothetical protein
LEFIESRGVVTHDNIKALFKYFSKYQHFSSKAHDFLLHHIEVDIIFYQCTLGELVMLLDQLMVFLELSNKTELKKQPVKKGYIIRTRADADAKQARINDRSDFCCSSKLRCANNHYRLLFKKHPFQI